MPRAVTKCVLVLLLLLPVDFLALPFNMTLADAWAAVALPLCWIVLARRAGAVRLPYLAPMLLILAATALASLLSADPGAGMVVVVQDMYLYAWMITLAAVFEQVDAADHRALLRAWLAGVLVHAAIVLAQFAHPPLLDAMASALFGASPEDVAYRPSGLSVNSNAAAGFQVMGFVPLLLLGLRARTLVPLLLLNAAAILATGSLGAAVATAAGVAAGLLVVVLCSGDPRGTAGAALRTVLAIGLFTATVALLLRGGTELGERLETLTLGRAERSAGGRFELWSRGADVLLADTPVVGIGPDRFRQLEGSELHNDLLSFAVERGLLGALGLCLLGAMAVARGVEAFCAGRAEGRLRAVVLPAAVAAAITASLTHEVFHSREVWLVLAVQEAVRWRGSRARGAWDAHASTSRYRPA